MIVNACEQGSDEWRAARLGLATASSFSDILAAGKGRSEAVSRRNYRIRLVLERISGRAYDGYQSAAMKQGTEREVAARLAYEVATGDLVQQVGFCRHDALEAGASPDGLFGDDEGLEIKSPEPSAHLETLRSRQVPSQYVAQVQGSLWITGRRRWRFCSFNPDFPERLQLVIVPVERDEGYIDRLAAEVEAFMREVREEHAEVERMP